MLRSLNECLNDSQGQLWLEDRNLHLMCRIGVKYLGDLVSCALVNQLQMHPIALNIAASHYPITWQKFAHRVMRPNERS
jgi:hypothetical protein